MKPEVWVPSLAALLAAFIPLVFTRLSGRSPQQDSGALPAARNRVWWIATAGAVVAALAVWFSPAEWRWPVLGACVVLTASAYVLVAWRRRRRVRLFPETLPFLQRWAGREAGYPYDRDFLPDLVRVYTKNDLSGTGQPSAPSAERRSAAAQDPPTSFEDLLVDSKIRHLAITGEAGTGKTSLLEFWNHDLRRRPIESGDRLSRLVPLLIAARHLVGRRSVAEAFGADGPAMLSGPPGTGMAWLVMIDAFDEITDAAARAEVERIVFEAIDEDPNPHRKFVVTSRGLTEDRRRSFDTRGVTEYQLQPFTIDQLHEFLVREETSARDIAGHNAAYEAAVAKVDRFLDRWEGHDDLLDLIRLPLLARVTATIYFQDPELDVPARRIDIYHDAIEHWISQFHKRMGGEEAAPALRLLHDWHAADGGPAPDTDAAVRELLRRLAVAFIESGQRSVIAIAHGILGVPVRPADPRRTQAMHTLLDATGLVHDVKAIDPRFLHKSYAEYLAAPVLFDQGADLEAWDAALGDPDRRIGAVFALGQMDPQRRRALFDAMAADGRFPMSCGWIAAEGLCVESDTGTIDRQRQAILAAACTAAVPPSPAAEWWTLIRALVAIESGRDLLAAVVEARRIDDWTLVSIARELATHDPRGVALLRSVVEDGSYHRLIQLSAIDELMAFEPEFGLTLLERYSDDIEADGHSRVRAASRMLPHRPLEAVARLRKLMIDLDIEPDARALAAKYLVENETEGITPQAAAFADLRSVSDGMKVDLASALVRAGDAAGTEILRGIARNDSCDESARVSAARELNNAGDAVGTELIRAFAADRNLSDFALLQARRVLAVQDGESEAKVLIATIEDRSRADGVRVGAAQQLDPHAPDRARRYLEAFATNTAIPETVRVAAMHNLCDHDRPRWLPRLREIAEDPGFADQTRLDAAEWLVDLDPEAGLAALGALATDTTMSDHARIRTYQSLTANGERRRLTELRRFAADPETTGAARVAAAEAVAKLDGVGGPKLLGSLAGDAHLSDIARVQALSLWIDNDPDVDPSRLQDMAEDETRDGEARVMAADRLAAHRRPEAMSLLTSLSANASLSDLDRCTAALTLIEYQPDEGLALLQDMAINDDFDHAARLKAIRSISRSHPASGMPILREFAADPAISDNSSTGAAYWLALRDETEGVRLLKAHARNDGFSCGTRVDAAEWLVEFDRATGLELLDAFAADPRFEDYARVDAASKLAGHDRPLALSHLRALTGDDADRTVLTALAAEEVARFDRPAGTRLLTELASDETADGLVRTIAATGLVRWRRRDGLAMVRRFAEDNAISPSGRLLAAQSLSGYDRPKGLSLLRRVAEDPSGGSTHRIAAAGMLTDTNSREGLMRMRAFTVDPSIDEVSRATAAWALSDECRLQGEQALAALRETAGEGTRCWIDVLSAERDRRLRDALPNMYARLAPSNLDRLLQEAAVLAEMSPQSGFQFNAWLKAIAAPAGRWPGRR